MYIYMYVYVYIYSYICIRIDSYKVYVCTYIYVLCLYTSMQDMELQNNAWMNIRISVYIDT